MYYKLAKDNMERQGDKMQTIQLLESSYELYEKDPKKDKIVQVVLSLSMLIQFSQELFDFWLTNTLK